MLFPPISRIPVGINHRLPPPPLPPLPPALPPLLIVAALVPAEPSRGLGGHVPRSYPRLSYGTGTVSKSLRAVPKSRVVEVGRGLGYETPKNFLRTVFSQLKWCENPEIFLRRPLFGRDRQNRLSYRSSRKKATSTTRPKSRYDLRIKVKLNSLTLIPHGIDEEKNDVSLTILHKFCFVLLRAA